MRHGIIYLRSGCRRPIWVGPYPQDDEQARIPRAWCCRCGGEIFRNGRLCGRCEGRRGANA